MREGERIEHTNTHNSNACEIVLTETESERANKTERERRKEMKKFIYAIALCSLCFIIDDVFLFFFIWIYDHVYTFHGNSSSILISVWPFSSRSGRRHCCGFIFYPFHSLYLSLLIAVTAVAVVTDIFFSCIWIAQRMDRDVWFGQTFFSLPLGLVTHFYPSCCLFYHTQNGFVAS